MGEEAARPAGGRQIIIIATVITVVFFTVFMMGLRSCGVPAEKTETKPKLSSHVVIYSNMDLKDSALVILRLKELKIPYQIKDEGRSIAVPRSRADDARLGLAEKNLPAGGTVGWEIFDQAKLGATDFDRRIQFIRAVSGELARTINRISAVDDARVQIVIPETKLFEVSKSPVTASVLLKLKAGDNLTSRQVSGIVHLVASSVENLKPENITIIDTNGNILSGTGYAPAAGKEIVMPKAEAEQEKEEVVIEKEKEMAAAGEKERAALEVQARLDLEDKLTSKVQSLLNKMYPPNVTIARANVDSLKTRKTTVIILIDKKYKIDPALKKSTFETVSAAVGYDKTRGDTIIIKSVVFRAAGPVQATTKLGAIEQVFDLATLKQLYRKFEKQSAIIIVALALLLFFLIIGLFMRGGKEAPAETIEVPAPVEEEVVAKEEEVPVVDQMRTLAAHNPAQAAEIIKTWIAEEG